MPTLIEMHTDNKILAVSHNLGYHILRLCFVTITEHGNRLL